MADLSDLQAAQTVKIAGATNTGIEDNYADVDSNNNLKVIHTNAGSVAPGTVAANSGLAGGQYNTVLPTLTNNQQSALQLTPRGSLVVSGCNDYKNVVGNGTTVIISGPGVLQVIMIN